MGRNVVMEQSFGATKVTKDGVNTAKSIEFKGKVKNVSFRLVVHVANATNDVSQYQIAWFCGTTCAIVLTRAIFTEGCKSVMAVGAAVTNLKSRARMISTSEEITQVGTYLLMEREKLCLMPVLLVEESVVRDSILVMVIQDGVISFSAIHFANPY
ncbi:Chaperonin CPN60-2, mitochondrial [Glycine max]|nr:Chaperonin CPN60-2, mitochondrial [Glycine max]